MVYTVGSLYAGVGGIDKGMENAGFRILWANEFDRYACKTYRANHPDSKLIESDVDSLDIAQLQAVDVLTSGFPCQPFSVAGEKLGFKDSKGNHFFTTVRIAKELDVRVLFLENVKGFRHHDKGNTYRVVVDTVRDAGYHFADTVLNTHTHANIPQNRERFFMVAFRDIRDVERFVFPSSVELTTTIHDFIASEHVDEKYYYRDGSSNAYSELAPCVTDKDTIYRYRQGNAINVRSLKGGYCPTLTSVMGRGGNNVPIILTDNGIRKLTPQECFRFQGFDDIRFPDDVSNTQLYKQAGNSVTVTVIERIARNIMKALTETDSE